MSGVNKVIIVGRLGLDPELKNIGEGNAVCNLSVATSETWNDKQGEKQERTEWHRIVIWGKLAENCAKYLTKGRQVYIEGRLQTRSWEDDNKVKKYTTEIVANTVQFLGENAEAKPQGDDVPVQGYVEPAESALDFDKGTDGKPEVFNHAPGADNAPPGF